MRRGCVEVEVLVGLLRLTWSGSCGSGWWHCCRLTRLCKLLLRRLDCPDSLLCPLGVLVIQELVLLLLPQQVLNLAVELLGHVVVGASHDPGIVEDIGRKMPRDILARLQHLGGAFLRQR